MTCQNRRLLLGPFLHTVTVVPWTVTCIQETILSVFSKHANLFIFYLNPSQHCHFCNTSRIPEIGDFALKRQQDGGDLLGTLDSVEQRVPAQS